MGTELKVRKFIKLKVKKFFLNVITLRQNLDHSRILPGNRKSILNKLRMLKNKKTAEDFCSFLFFMNYTLSCSFI